METKEVSGSIRPIDLVVAGDNTKVYAINGALASTGGSNVSITAIARKIPISLQDLLFNGSSTSINPLIDEELQEIIDSYASSRGYTTNVSVADVQDYLQTSADYLSALLWLYKAQNAKRMIGYDGFDIGGWLGSRPSVLADGDDLAQYVVNGVAVPNAVVNDAAVGINNTDWSTMLATLAHVRLSAPIVSLLVGLFGVDYMVQGNGANAIYQLFPSGLANATAAMTTLTGYGTTLAGYRNSFPDLADIMEFIGYSSDFVVGMDFTRDQRGLTPSIVQDPEFDYIRVNSAIDFGGYFSNDDDRRDVYYDIHGDADFVNFDKDKEISAATILKHKILDNWGASAGASPIQPHFRSYLWIEGNGTYTDGYFFPFAMSFDIQDTITDTMTSRAQSILLDTFFTASPFLPVTYRGLWRQLVSGGVAGFTQQTLSTVGESFNSYLLDKQGINFYKLAKFAEMFMNGVEYRSALQALTNKIRPLSVTKQS